MGFLKNMFRMNTVCLGKVNGSGFAGCYIGLAKKNGEPALMFFGSSLKEDYVFNKNDIKNVTVIGNGMEKNAKGMMTSVTKYQIDFKDGKTAICSVDQNGSFASNFEARIY
ncbi:MAG: hypothetical protein ACI4MZ_05565 [Christensenellales bacterium]